MFKKLLATLLVFSVFSTKTFAGDYIHGIGAGYNVVTLGGGPYVHYTGRMNYADFSDGEMSLGFSFSPQVGLNLVTGNTGLNLGVNVSPVEFSFGPAATKDAKGKFGFGVAPLVGFGYALSTGGSYTLSTGAEAAFRFAAGSHPMSVGWNYLIPIASGYAGGTALLTGTMSFKYTFFF